MEPRTVIYCGGAAVVLLCRVVLVCLLTLSFVCFCLFVWGEGGRAVREGGGVLAGGVFPVCCCCCFMGFVCCCCWLLFFGFFVLFLFVLFFFCSFLFFVFVLCLLLFLGSDYFFNDFYYWLVLNSGRVLSMNIKFCLIELFQINR